MKDDENNDQGQHTGLIERFANLLIHADYVLIVAGAGMSAESGLSTYECMPEEYRELCNPLALVQQTERFQQFWSNSGNTYGACQPHRGYDILKKWCTDSSDEKQRLPNLKSYWIYTSNVDGHFRRVFPTNRICEIHGFAGEFCCPNKMGIQLDGTKRRGALWEKWNALVDKHRSQGTECGPWGIVGKDGAMACPSCGLPGRPNVLMFHDTDENILRHIDERRAAYQAWEAHVENDVVQGGKKLVILELGCGTNVPALRIESEEVLRDCMQSSADASVVLVRVNPKDSKADDIDLADHVLSIPLNALIALCAADEMITQTTPA